MYVHKSESQEYYGIVFKPMHYIIGRDGKKLIPVRLELFRAGPLMRHNYYRDIGPLFDVIFCYLNDADLPYKQVAQLVSLYPLEKECLNRMSLLFSGDVGAEVGLICDILSSDRYLNKSYENKFDYFSIKTLEKRIECRYCGLYISYMLFPKKINVEKYFENQLNSYNNDDSVKKYIGKELDILKHNRTLFFGLLFCVGPNCLALHPVETDMRFNKHGIKMRIL